MSEENLVFAEEDLFIFEEEDNTSGILNQKNWKIMIVDDEPEVHKITKLVLQKFVFEGRGIEFIDAFSESEAYRLIDENLDTALILLDIVMEEDDSGLRIAKYIRNESKNRLVRIVLRTGQPGQAPEESIILNYDINGYKEKTELTSQKLFSEVVSALRGYRDLQAIENSRKSLRKIISSTKELFNIMPMRDFVALTIKQLISIVNENANEADKDLSPSCFVATKAREGFLIIAGCGIYSKSIHKTVSSVESANTIELLQSVYDTKKNYYGAEDFILYLHGKRDVDSIIYYKGSRTLSETDRDMIEVFLSNVRAVKEALVNSHFYETEKKQRQLSDALRETNTRLTSTFDMKEIIERFLDGMSSMIEYKKAITLLNKNNTFELFIQKEPGSSISKNGQIETGLYWIISRIVATGNAMLIEDIYENSEIRKDVKFGDSVRSILGFPLLSNGKLLGITILQDTKSSVFTENDKDLAMVFASQAGIAIENAYLFNRINERNHDIRTLLDNTGQGFLFFGEDLLINREFSAECEKMFNVKIAGCTFPQLLYADQNERTFWEDALISVINEKDELKKEVLISLLPREAFTNGKMINLDYKIIKSSLGNKLMVIMTDITDKRKLEGEVENERKTLKMVVKVVANFNDFTNSIKDYQSFCYIRIQELLTNGQHVEEIMLEIFRHIHTFKGVFSQLGILNIVSKLHGLETEMYKFKKNIHEKTIEDLVEFINQFDLCKWLDEDMQILQEVLGEQFFNKDKIIFVDESKLLEIENKVSMLLPKEESNALRRDIRRLRYKNLNELLAPYVTYTKDLCEKLSKTVNDVEIEGGAIPIDFDRYNGFIKSLTHVFRNCVDHGIEYAEDRLKSEKNEAGNIRCKIMQKDNLIYMTIADDGRGIDIHKLKQSAVEKNIYDEMHIDNIGDEEALALIFRDDFSTVKDITEFSGRGFGLSVVKREVDKLGGKINVETRTGIGTRFNFIIPLLED